MLIDTHCHLDAAEFDADRDAVVQAAACAGVGAIVVPAVERANFGAVASVCRDHAVCAPAWGIHPMYVHDAREADLDALREILRHGQPVAVGEIGLDRYAEPRDEVRQAHYFEAQLDIARDAGLPVLLHTRRAVDAVLAALRRQRVAGGIAHAFGGSRQQADEMIRLGFKLGFGGAIGHPRATRLRALAATLPLTAIVLETDAPDMPPYWLAGGRNTPGQLPRIAQTLAELRGITPQAVAQATAANARAVLPGLDRIH